MSNKSGFAPSEGGCSSDSDRSRTQRSVMMINQLLEENEVLEVEDYRSFQSNLAHPIGDGASTSYAFHTLYTVHEETEEVTEVVTEVKPALTHLGDGDKCNGDDSDASVIIVENASVVMERKPNQKRSTLRVDEMLLRSLVVLDNKKGCSLPRLREYMNIAYCYRPRSYRMLKRYLKIGLARNKLISVTGNYDSTPVSLNYSFFVSLVQQEKDYRAPSNCRPASGRNC